MAIAYSKRFIVFGNGYKGGSEKVGEADTEEEAREIMRQIAKNSRYVCSYKVDMGEHKEEELKTVEMICNSVEDGIIGTYGLVISKEDAHKQLEKAASIYKGMKDDFNRSRAERMILNAEWMIKNY